MATYITLNSIRYEIDEASGIVDKQVSPWAAKIGSGGVEFGNFSPCDIEEYSDLRGGLGLESAESSTNKFYRAEGIETSKDRYWTLGALVTTAGAFNAAPLKIIDFESATYAFATSVSQYWTGSAWAAADASPLTTPTDAITFKDETDNYLAICNGSEIRYCSIGYGDSKDWAQLTTSDVKYMAAMDNKLWGISSTGTTLYYSAVGNIDGTWASFNLSGDYTTVTDLFDGKLLTTGEPCLYMLTAEGLFAIDVYAQKAYKMDVRFPLTTNAKSGLYWNGAIYISTGLGIAKITQRTVEQFGLDENDGLDTDYQGYVYNLLGISHWIIANVAGGTNDSLFKRHESEGGWHQIYSSSSAIECLHYSPASLYSPGRLWFGDGSNIKYVQFPDLTHDVTKVTGYTYAASGDLILPRFSKLSIIPKIALRVEGLTEDFTTDEKIAVYYRKDDETSWTPLGEMTTSAHPTIAFGSNLGTSFNDIQFKLSFARGETNTNTPKMRAFALKYLALPATVTAWQFTVRALGDRAPEIISNLETARDAATLVNFSPDGDLNVSTYYVRIMSVPGKRWLNKYAKQKDFSITVSEVE